MFLFTVFKRRRRYLAVYERGFCASGVTVAYDDVQEVRIGRSDGKFVKGLTKLNAVIPTAQNQGAARLLQNSHALSLTLILKNGRVVPLRNFFACYQEDALVCVVPNLESKLDHDSSSATT